MLNKFDNLYKNYIYTIKNTISYQLFSVAQFIFKILYNNNTKILFKKISNLYTYFITKYEKAIDNLLLVIVVSIFLIINFYLIYKFYNNYGPYIKKFLLFVYSLIATAFNLIFKLNLDDILIDMVNFFFLKIYELKNYILYLLNTDIATFKFYLKVKLYLIYLYIKNILILDDFKFDFISIIPIFMIFNIFFLLTTIFSFISISFLGIYGIFILNFLSLLLFWVSIIYYVFLVFFKNIWFFITVGNWGYLFWNFKITFDIIIDLTSLSFLFLTLTIGLNVFLYVFSYFRYEPLVERLLLMINWFILSMNLLVVSGNLFVLMLGWEFIGLSSFFLINFWINRIGTFKSGFKAYSFNKISDVFLLISILLIFNITYSIDIITIVNQIYIYESYFIKIFFIKLKYLDLLSLFLIGCICIKSAQIIGHLWLPDSMEAPVPASALIHSATLVSAGIFLLIRFSPIFELSFLANILLPIIGSITALYGGLTAAFQSDTKKTLAYSTISHCGFLVLLYTTNVTEFTILYLYVHGFFKATSFLCIGNINRFNKNNQDFKSMGLFYKYLPFDCILTLLCLINLSSLPLTLGFYSKHLLFLVFEKINYLYYFIYSVTIFSSLTGIFYSFRLFYNIYFDIKKSKKINYIVINNNIYNSINYSNTSLASNIIISILFIKAYIIIYILYNITISKNYFISDVSTFKNINTYISCLSLDSNSLMNISLLNWIILLLIIFFIILKWRFELFFYKNLNKIWFLFKVIIILKFILIL
jgi:NADH:ubiquinone oxidoreductase subunit 5 (subunit L)/multisubunit Na+/H+ antiporter MnhA subunit